MSRTPSVPSPMISGPHAGLDGRAAVSPTQRLLAARLAHVRCLSMSRRVSCTAPCTKPRWALVSSSENLRSGDEFESVLAIMLFLEHPLAITIKWPGAPSGRPAVPGPYDGLDDYEGR
jgi:hypothetical protein